MTLSALAHALTSCALLLDGNRLTIDAPALELKAEIRHANSLNSSE